MNLFEIYSKNEIESYIEKITKLLLEKKKDFEILKKIDCKLNEELLSIAKAREKNNHKYKFIGKIKYFNLSDIRFATPLEIADYRAKKLSTNKIVDLCSGIGIQANSFSKFSKQVFAFEIDPKKARYAKENFPSLNIFTGDVLSKEIIEKVKEISPDIIFCDPERLETEEIRDIEKIKPDLKKLIEVYSKICSNICIEMPPQIDISKLSDLGDFEAEYISFENKLNRLNLYFGSLKKTKISVVDIKTGHRLIKSNSALNKSSKPLKYLFEISTAVTKSGLTPELANEIQGFYLSDKYLTSNTPLKNPLSKKFEIIEFSKNKKDIINSLKKNKIAKVILRGKIDPKEYWKERNSIENLLSGTKSADLFYINDLMIIAKEVL